MPQEQRQLQFCSGTSAPEIKDETNADFVVRISHSHWISNGKRRME